MGVAEAAMFHHTPLQCPNKEFAPLTAVHISGAVQARTVAGLAPALLAQLDEQYQRMISAALENRNGSSASSIH